MIIEIIKLSLAKVSKLKHKKFKELMITMKKIDVLSNLFSVSAAKTKTIGAPTPTIRHMSVANTICRIAKNGKIIKPFNLLDDI